MPATTALALICVFALLLAIAGCETMGYYGHVAGGQLSLLSKRQAVARLLAEATGPADGNAEAELLLERLALSQRMLDFAERELTLDVGGRYRSYVHLDRSSVVWNLFAAPELSLKPEQWCYPFVGCAPYRGYFDLTRARRYQAGLEARGLETWLGSVPAYSTLGWFDDPLLSTFIFWPEAELAALLFHELAHSRVWVKGDVTFNESFASFVGERGMQAWLEAEGRNGYAGFTERREARRRVLDLLRRTRGSLAAAYDADIEPAAKAARKVDVISAARGCFEAYVAAGGDARYQPLFDGLNNALLVSLGTYSDAVPAFAALFAQVDGRWEAFFEAAASLGGLDDEARESGMRALAEQQPAADGDDDGTNQIQCEALAGHGFDGEAAGAEHDHVGRGSHG